MEESDIAVPATGPLTHDMFYGLQDFFTNIGCHVRPVVDPAGRNGELHITPLDPSHWKPATDKAWKNFHNVSGRFFEVKNNAIIVHAQLRTS